MTIQILILLFVVFVVAKIVNRWRRHDISGGEFTAWVIFWTLVALAAIFPQQTDIVAQQIGVGRGADLLVYISVIAIFYMIFRVFIRLEKMERDISKVVEDKAVTNPQKKDD